MKLRMLSDSSLNDEMMIEGLKLQYLRSSNPCALFCTGFRGFSKESLLPRRMNE